MRLLLLMLGTVAVGPGTQATTSPRLPAEGADAAAFAPRGWLVETSKRGDVNGDKLADLVFVLQPAHATDKRILGVALGRGAGKPYRLIVQNAKMVPGDDDPTMGDPFNVAGGLEIGRSAFRVKLIRDALQGTLQGDVTFTFRIIGGQCLLIGRDDVWVDRGEIASISENYLTRERIETRSPGPEPEKITSLRKTRLPRTPLKPIEQVAREFAIY